MEAFSTLLAICAGNSPVPGKGQWRGALMFTLICARINGWVNNHKAGDLRRHRAHYDIIVIIWWQYCMPEIHFNSFTRVISLPALEYTVVFHLCCYQSRFAGRKHFMLFLWVSITDMKYIFSQLLFFTYILMLHFLNSYILRSRCRFDSYVYHPNFE